MFDLTIISNEITLFIGIGALTARFSVLQVMVNARDCIHLQNLTPSVAFTHTSERENKSYPLFVLPIWKLQVLALQS